MSARDLFADVAEDIWTAYRAEIAIRGVIVGGVPSSPSVIRSWLTARLDLGDTALEEVIAETIAARDAAMSVEDKVDAVMTSGQAPSVNGFKRNAEGFLCVEGRTLKAGLKEAANSSYPGTKWPGKPADIRKGLMRYLAEVVHVDEALVSLGVREPTRVEERIKHVMTPAGPRSAINAVEVVEAPKFSFMVRVRDDVIVPLVWGRVWQSLEEIGLGSDRARSDGKFDLVGWDRV